MSGITLHEDCILRYNELKQDHSLRFLILRISPDYTNIIVDKTAPPSATWEDFERALPQDDCRYGFFDFEFEKDGERRKKIIILIWCPDSSKIKHKMLYCAARDTMTNKLVGWDRMLDATDPCEMAKEQALALVNH